jgi:formate/nitrite transporter
MAISDAYSVSETIQIISATGVKKSKQRIDHLIIKSLLAGVLVSFGGLFLITVGGGSAPLAQSFGSSIHRMTQAAVFPIGLILIVFTGADLFTGNTMTLTVSTLHRKTKWFHLAISWTVSFFGNLFGCLFFQYIFVYHAGLLSNEPYRSYTMRFAEAKGNIEWYQMFLRGIGGNWLVCLALWLATSARDLNSKVIGIFLPIWLFISVGYEHSIANMFTVQMGMLLGANLSIGKYILRVLIPVTLGNIVGGGFFVGVIYWYLYLARNDATDSKGDAGSPVDNSYQAVKQNEDVIQSQRP